MNGAIDLSQTPPPDVVEQIAYERILSDRKARLVSYYPANEQAAVAADLERDSDPRTKILQENSWRETVLRQRVNEAALATMLPYAQGADLDARAATYNVQRLTITPAAPAAIPPTPAVMESDAALRRRCLLSLEGLSVAGPPGAYEFHALSADGRVLDAAVDAPRFSLESVDHDARTITWSIEYDAGLDEPRPGNIVVSILAREGDGTAGDELVGVVHDALYADNVRPATDEPIVRTAEIVKYNIDATLYVYDGPDSSIVVADARAAIAKYIEDTHKLGYDVALSGIYAALQQPGVQRVELHSPTQTLTIGPQQAPYCTGINLAFGGRDE